MKFPFKSSLNASTLVPYKLDLKTQLKVASEAGYDGYELWLRDLDTYVAEGGTLSSLRNYIADCDIALPNAIAFFKWADADQHVRAIGVEQAKREMSMLAEIGCSAVAVPPCGDVENVGVNEFAEHYGKLIELGRELGVEPFLEFWGKAAKLSTLEEAIAIMNAGGYSQSKVLLDPFHMYTGGSQLASLEQLSGGQIGIVHANDYPLDPPRATITDKSRLFPGDGVAPLKQLAATLNALGYSGYISLELFKEAYGELTAVEAAAFGLRKMMNAFEV